MKKAIIVGSSGQDGTLLYDLLLNKNYSIIGIDNNEIKSNHKDYKKPIDISNKEVVNNLIKDFEPNEIYYLAAFHHSSEDKPIDDEELFHKSYNINFLYFNTFLSAIKLFSPKSKIFFAASSHIFGIPSKEIQDENTPFNPNSIYGITKLNGLLLSRYYRNKYSIFASTGILYNHESHLRSDKFLSKKIIKGAINIKNKKQNKIIIGNLDAQNDWGYAPDFVDAMHKILNIKNPDEFIIATGIKHSVKDFVKITFNFLGLNWEEHIEENKEILTRQKNTLIGNPEKILKTSNWKPNVNFQEMIKILLIKEGANIINE